MMNFSDFLSRLEQPGKYLIIAIALSLLLFLAMAVSRAYYRQRIVLADYERGSRQRNLWRMTRNRLASVMLIMLIWLGLVLQVVKMMDGNLVVPVGVIIGATIFIFFKGLAADMMRGIEIIRNGHYLVGDFIEAAEIRGHVIDLNLSMTKLRTTSGQEVVLPNSRCLPARRFPGGYVDCFVDMVLAEPGHFENAKQLLYVLGRDFKETEEVIRDLPEIAAAIGRHKDRRPVIRWHLRVLPGEEGIVKQKVIPSLKHAFGTSGVGLLGEPAAFVMNEPRVLRQLFQRELNEAEVADVLSKSDSE